jgi:hypothetical protein
MGIAGCMSGVQEFVGVLVVFIFFDRTDFGIKKAARLGSLVRFSLSLSPSLVISHWPDCPNTIMSPANQNEDQQNNKNNRKR